MALKPLVRLTDTNGNIQPLASMFIRDLEWELVDLGGCGQFTLTLDARIGDALLSPLPNVGWQVDIYTVEETTGAMSPAYRGFIDESPPSFDIGAPTVAYYGNGRMAQIKSFDVGTVYAKPYTSDVSQAYAWIATRYLNQPLRIPRLQSYIAPSLGYPIERADFSTADCRQALDSLTDASQGSVIWGFSFTGDRPFGRDRFWAMPKPTGVTRSDYVFSIGETQTGSAVRYIDQQTYTADIINAIRLTGAAAKSPNLAYNPSFEIPVIPGSGESDNYLGNASFETLPGHGTIVWTLGGTATIRAADAKQGEGARTGTAIGEVDTDGESLQQTATLPATVNAGTPFLLLFYYSAESALGSQNNRLFSVKLESLDASNTLLETLIDPAATPDSFGHIPAHSAWVFEEFRQQVVTAVDGCAKLRLTLAYSGTQIGTSDADKQIQAVAFDDVFLFRADALGQDGWEHTVKGTGAGTIDWAFFTAPTLAVPRAYHGAYCLRANLAGCGSIGRQTDNTVVVQTTNNHWISVETFTAYRFRVHFRSSVGYDSIRLGAIIQKSGNLGQVTSWSSYQTLTGDGTWEELFFDVTTDGDSQAVRLMIEFSKDGTVDIDAIDFFNYGLEHRSDFIPADNLEYYFRADNSTGAIELPMVSGGGVLYPDPDPKGLTDLAATSSGTYGLREARVQADLSDIDAAKTFAVGYLNDNAIPKIEGKLTLDPVEVLVRHVDPDAATGTNTLSADGWIRVLGFDPPLPDQWPAVIKYSRREDGYLRCEIDLSTRRPDLALLIKSSDGGQVSGAVIQTGGNVSIFNSVVNGGSVSGGTIAIAGGGTGETTAGAAFDALSPLTTLGDMLYGGASGTGTRIGGNTSTTKKFLSQTGDGTASATPVWTTLASGDMPSGWPTLAQVTGNGASTSTLSTFSGGLIGPSLAPASGTLLLGTGSTPAGLIYLGKGLSNASPVGVNLVITPATGTNVLGGDLQLMAGISTGSASGGSLRLYTSPPGTAGTGTNSLQVRMDIGAGGAGSNLPSPISSEALVRIGATALSGGSSAGTYLGLNGPSGFTGDLVNLQVNGISQFKVSATGAITQNSVKNASSLATDSNGKIIAGSGSRQYPIGALYDWPGASGTWPVGALERNGQAISRTTYAALFALFGTAAPFGPGDGSTTFNLPDDRGLVEIGVDGTTYTLGATGGGSTSVSTSTGSSTSSGTTSANSNVGDLIGVPSNPTVSDTVQGYSGTGSFFHVSDVIHNHTFSESSHTHTFSDGGHSHSIILSTIQTIPPYRAYYKLIQAL